MSVVSRLVKNALFRDEIRKASNTNYDRFEYRGALDDARRNQLRDRQKRESADGKLYGRSEYRLKGRIVKSSLTRNTGPRKRKNYTLFKRWVKDRGRIRKEKDFLPETSALRRWNTVE